MGNNRERMLWALGKTLLFIACILVHSYAWKDVAGGNSSSASFIDFCALWAAYHVGHITIPERTHG